MGGDVADGGSHDADAADGNEEAEVAAEETCAICQERNQLLIQRNLNDLSIGRTLLLRFCFELSIEFSQNRSGHQIICNLKTTFISRESHFK